MDSKQQIAQWDSTSSPHLLLVILTTEIFYGRIVFTHIAMYMKAHRSHITPPLRTHLSLLKVKHTKLKVSASSRLSLSPESPFKKTHTLTQRPRHDTTTSRLGQAMKGSMNNLTPNIIFPLAVMYTEGGLHAMCVWADTREVSIHFLCVPLYAERWLFQRCNVMCGSIIRAVGMTDTQP